VLESSRRECDRAVESEERVGEDEGCAGDRARDEEERKRNARAGGWTKSRQFHRRRRVGPIALGGMGAREQHVVVLFCFDHIKAKSARKTLVELVQEFRVTGVLRRGKPGM